MDWLPMSILRLSMRARLIGLVLFALTQTLHASFAEEQFPYAAYISQEGAYVRSGPGRRYYPTGQVPQGYAVEVYRHDNSGWCAVRPTHDSFSWVSAHEVRRLSDQVAEVTAEQAVARVGSTLSPVRSAVQVMLPRGERVRLLALRPEDDPRWLRIVAPAGEFRWVAAQHLSRRPPMEVTPPPQAAGASGLGWGTPNPHPNHIAAAPLPPNEFAHLRQTENTRPSQTLATPQQLPLNPRLDQENVEVIAGSPAATQLAQYQAQSQGLSSPPLLNQVLNQATPHQSSPRRAKAPLVETTGPRVRFPNLTASLGAWSEDVATLELLLSQMVAQPPALWELKPLEGEASALLASTDSSAERVQLRDLLGRINRFEHVQQEYKNPVSSPLAQPDFGSSEENAINDNAANTGAADDKEEVSRVVDNVRERVKQDLRDLRNPAPGLTQAAVASEQPRYDAVGKLKPVVSKREQAPPYALVNEKGEVVSFVTPAPDLNLQPYIGRHVGIQGNRGFMPEYRKAHVTAGRVSPIEERLRR